MGYKSTFRSIGAIARRVERDSIRKQKELEKRRVYLNKMEEKQQAAYEVDVYENYIERITSLHKDCGEEIDWAKIQKTNPPTMPSKNNNRAAEARNILESYKPGIFDKIFKKETRKRNELERLLQKAIAEDEKQYNISMLQYNHDLSEYNETIKLAQNVLSGNTLSYKKAFEELSPLKEISDIGSSIDLTFKSKDHLNIILHIHGDKVVPKQTKSLLKSGKLSIKDTPIGKYNEIYQDYVCSATIRVARELFALLPIESILLNAKGKLVNSANGRLEELTILSVLYIRETMSNIDFSYIDPSDSMKNFKHNMGFKKTQGLIPVQEISL